MKRTLAFLAVWLVPSLALAAAAAWSPTALLTPDTPRTSWHETGGNDSAVLTSTVTMNCVNTGTQNVTVYLATVSGTKLSSFWLLPQGTTCALSNPNECSMVKLPASSYLMDPDTSSGGDVTCTPEGGGQ